MAPAVENDSAAAAAVENDAAAPAVGNREAPTGRPGDPIVVIGAGPAGLTAAYELVRRGDPVVVLEADDVVGGISRTVERDGWRFDIGGHRFFTKVRPVEDFWHEMLPPEDFLLRPRMSRIYYQGKFYDYPLKAVNALAKPGAVGGVPVRALVPVGPDPTPEGPDQLRGLAGGPVRVAPVPHFFKTYTEKVWGVPVRDCRPTGPPNG